MGRGTFFHKLIEVRASTGPAKSGPEFLGWESPPRSDSCGPQIVSDAALCAGHYFCSAQGLAIRRSSKCSDSREVSNVPQETITNLPFLSILGPCGFALTGIGTLPVKLPEPGGRGWQVAIICNYLQSIVFLHSTCFAGIMSDIVPEHLLPAETDDAPAEQ